MRAWAAKYKDKGLVVIGVHTPEFSVEHDIANVRRAAQAMRVDYPIAVDSDYGVWRAFNNAYWPAVYIADAKGQIRYHHFGEEAYEETERVIQQLLAEAGAPNVGSDLVAVDPRGTEVAADWSNVKSGESYVGSEKRENFASPRGPAGKPYAYTVARELRLNQWGLAGEWTVGTEIAAAEKPKARIVYRFHARDVNLVMGPGKAGQPVQFRVLDRRAPAGVRPRDRCRRPGDGNRHRAEALSAHPPAEADRGPHVRDRVSGPRRRDVLFHVRLRAGVFGGRSIMKRHALQVLMLAGALGLLLSLNHGFTQTAASKESDRATLRLFRLSIPEALVPGQVRRKSFVYFKTAEVAGLRLFYREAGDPSKPTVVLLHGFPSSSHQFHDLIPLSRIGFMWGRNDPLILPAAAEFVKQVVPKADLRYFDGGHFVLDDYVDAIAEAIIGTFSR